MRNLANFYQGPWKSQNWDFYGGTFIQSWNCMSLKFTGEVCVVAMKNDRKFEKEWTCQFKIDKRNLTNFGPSTRKISNNLHFWPKYIMLQLRKYRGVMFDGMFVFQIDKKNWRKTSLCFLPKMTWGIWQIFTRALKSLEIRTLMGLFCPKLKICELKFTGELTMKHDAKLEEEFQRIFYMRNWHEEFDEVWPKHSKV